MRFALSAVLGLSLLASFPAQAFCGFYVSGAGAKLFNDATMVVLMREGTRTVLSMQNNYRGPAESFAMVVPVPVVLQKENVKTLPNEVFARVDQLASPRLVVEYEPGECPPPPPVPAAAGGRPEIYEMKKDHGVKVEAKFDVAEYQIVILSAKDALGLDTWLHENGYKTPEGAEPLLKPYVQAGSKFFVAKVDAKKVKFENGSAVLSPLRFHYDAEAFTLPVRLGLINSAGQQDLMVHLIAKSRYELANRPNVVVPSNLRLAPSVESEFGPFYANLVDQTFKKTPSAAVTEFAWKGALPGPQVLVQQGIYHVTCDPCPPPMPVDDPLARLLGADALPGLKSDEDVARFARDATLTRLHLRYTKESLGDDLVFKAAEPIAGGVPEQAKTGPARENRFQGRYIITKPFDASRACRVWGPFGGAATPTIPSVSPFALTKATPAPATGPQAKGGALSAPFESYLISDVPELGLTAKAKKPGPKPGSK